jgi:hypothetical protein
VQINEVTSLNPSPGRPLTSASAACVGEPITLSISGTNIFPGYNFVTGYNWHLPNAIKNYNPFASGSMDGDAPITALSGSDTSAGSLTVYYPAVPQTGSSSSVATSGTESVSCDLTLSAGGTCTVTAPLNIVAPSVQVSGSMPGYLNLANTRSGDVATGVFIDGANNNLFTGEPSGFQANSSAVTWVTPKVGFTSGSCAWLQVINDTANHVSTEGYQNLINYVNYNDHGFPYPFGDLDYIVQGSIPEFTSDNPSWSANYPPETELDRTFSAGMFYMWISDVPKSIWVPLWVTGWGFNGRIIWSTRDQQWEWSGTPKKSSIINKTPNQEPSWAHTSHL